MSEHPNIFHSLHQVLARTAHASRWFVAFSGGLDSTVLLHLVNSWRQSHPGSPELLAWHINHGLQDAANEWQLHCATVCDDWGIPLVVNRARVGPAGKGVEAAAREARYTVFSQELAEGDVLLMAHHLDDQVETFFLRLLRGAGLQGMSAMPSERVLGSGLLLRPLLETGREQLRDYAQEQGLAYVDDPSNTDTSMDRNFLRHQVIPLLGERWSGYRQTVTRASGHVASALATLEHNLPQPVTVYSTLGDPGLPLQVLTSGSRDVAAIRLRAWLRSAGLSMPDHAAADEFLRQLNEAAEDSSPRLDCGSYSLQRYGDAVYLLPEPWQGASRAGPLRGGTSCEVAGVGLLSLVTSPVEGIALAEGECVDISWRSGGERCKPQGRGHSQTLKKLLQERAVPPWWRDRVPLVFLGGEMLAVGDLWLCESSRLRQSPRGGDSLWQFQWKRNTFAAVD